MPPSNTTNFSIQGSDTTGGAANSVTIDYGPTGNGGAIDSTGTFLSQNFDFVNVNVGGFFGASFVTPDVPFYSGGIVAEANTDTLEALTIDATETYFARPHGPFESITLEVGNISTGKLGFEFDHLAGRRVNRSYVERHRHARHHWHGQRHHRRHKRQHRHFNDFWRFRHDLSRRR